MELLLEHSPVPLLCFSSIQTGLSTVLYIYNIPFAFFLFLHSSFTIEDTRYIFTSGSITH